MALSLQEKIKLRKRLSPAEVKKVEKEAIVMKGEKGDKGLDGKDGRNGKDGEDGKDGRSIKGDKGDKGFTGEDGNDGKDGHDGKDGLKGEKGEKGQPGKDGRRGPKTVSGGGYNKNPILKTLTVGTEDDNFKVEEDGTWVNDGEGTTWDEISQSFVGVNIFTVAGRVDYNFTELTLDFNTNARYPDEPVAIVVQSPHARKDDSDIRPHLHWIQTSDSNPNILVQYRFYNNGESVSSWNLKALTSSDNAFTFTGSGMQQITSFNLPEGHGDGLGLSFTADVKIYRDSANTSGLFSGADSYTGAWSAKYYDIHFERDMNGSREEFVK